MSREVRCNSWVVSGPLSDDVELDISTYKPIRTLGKYFSSTSEAREYLTSQGLTILEEIHDAELYGYRWAFRVSRD